MEPQVLYDSLYNPFIRIELNPAGWLNIYWQGEIEEEKIKRGGNLILEAIHQTGCKYLVNDHTKLEGSWLENIDWIVDELMPEMLKSGNKYIAHVLSPEFITKFSAIELEARLNSPGFKLFYDLDDAESWIKSKMKSGK